jgi:hypothetical protein
LICPKCRAEYREGFDRCADCDIQLVDCVLPPPVDDPPVELASLLSTTDVGYLPIVKSLLDAAGIPYVVQGEEALGLLPVGAYSGGVGPGAVRATIHVPVDRIEEARALLEDQTQVLKDNS